MVLVSPERTTTERQRVELEAPEQEASTQGPAPVVGAQDNAQAIPNRIRHAREALSVARLPGGTTLTVPVTRFAQASA